MEYIHKILVENEKLKARVRLLRQKLYFQNREMQTIEGVMELSNQFIKDLNKDV